MSASLTLNTDAFRREFRARLLRTKSELSVTVNRVAYGLAQKAIDYTPKADRSEIEKLGLSGYQIVGKSGKRLKKPKPIWVVMRKMRNIYVGRLYRAEGVAAVKEFFDEDKWERNRLIMEALKERMRAISYLKSGWVPIRNTLAKALGSARVTGEGIRAGRAKGRATPAQSGWNPTAILENFTQPQGDRAPIAHRKMEAAFQRAIDAETDEMAKHAGNLIGKNFA